MDILNILRGVALLAAEVDIVDRDTLDMDVVGQLSGNLYRCVICILIYDIANVSMTSLISLVLCRYLLIGIME